jgi:D-alanyl-lipoteichoic acid acyltransferase DltB (MBOAT superfamily)
MEIKMVSSRQQIGIRFLYSLVFIFIHQFVKMLVVVTTIFQFIYLLIFMETCEPIRRLANKLSTFAYRCLRYLTLNENQKPFPFQEFPEEMEPPASEVEM